VGKPERLAEVTPVAWSALLSSQFTPEQKDWAGRGRRASAEHKSRSHEPGASSEEKRVENGKEKETNEQPRTARTRTKERAKLLGAPPYQRERERDTGRGNARVKAHGLFVHDVTYMSVSFLFFHPFIACWFLGPVSFVEKPWLKVPFR